MDRPTLSARIERLEAAEQIRTLVGRYGAAVDAKDAAGIAGLFTPRAVFALPDGEIHGRERIEGFYRERLAKYRFTFHYTHDVVLTHLDQDHAEGRVTAHAEHEVDGECLVAALSYHDSYARVDGEWRFAARRMEFHYFLPASDFAGAFAGGRIVRRPTEVSDHLLAREGD